MTLQEALAVLDNDTGSHFDPAVMVVFRPLAADIHATLVSASEAGLRRLLQKCIRRHFEV